jgi:hypothetical protein
MNIIRYMKSMQIYRLSTSYNKRKESHQNKGASKYIDERPITSRNVAMFINSSHPNTTNKKKNYMFEEHKENQIMVFATRTISAREMFLGNVFDRLYFE